LHENCKHYQKAYKNRFLHPFLTLNQGLTLIERKSRSKIRLWRIAALLGRLVPSTCGVEAFRRSPKLKEPSRKLKAKPKATRKMSFRYPPESVADAEQHLIRLAE
jgi:hypothetical protein